MLEAIITWSLRNRLLVILLSIGLVGAGLWSLSQLPIDAFPDTTPVMVQINTTAPALAPEEIERQAIVLVERALAGLPRLQEVRSVSKFGFGQVNVVFEDGTDIYRARQMVSERLSHVQLPAGIQQPELGPISTGLGEIFHYMLTSPTRSLTELTTLQDWVIAPQLQSVPGVAEVNTWGGARKQYQVVVEPNTLVKYDLTLDDVIDALRRNNLSVGGGQTSTAGELHLIQGLALTADEKQVGNIVIAAHEGVPVRISNVAEVREGHEIRRGATTFDGRGEAVYGLGFMLMGENAHEVSRRLEERVAEVRRTLPADVELTVVLERTDLVNRVIETVKTNLGEGALLVVAVLFAFLGNLRAGLIVAAAIPLAMLFSFSAMLQVGIAASLLSLGAIDFGLVVDSSVILVENSVRRLSNRQDRRTIAEIVRDAVLEVRRPTMFGELIIMVVYLPILLLEGVEGKMFRPMALTVVFALGSSLILSLTLIPVLASLLLKRKSTGHQDNLLVRAAQAVHRPLLQLAMRFPRSTVLLTVLLLAFGAHQGMKLGREFIPRLYEGSIVFNAVRLAGISLDESVRYNTRIEQFVLKEFSAEVEHIWSRIGTPQISTDPMGLELTDTFITLKPRDQWKRARTQEELAALLAEELAAFPGQNLVFTQPIEMRMKEMIGGIRSDLGIKIFGDDLDTLQHIAGDVAEVLRNVPGNADVSVEQLTGLPVLQVQVDQDAIARHGIAADHVLEVIEAMGGIHVGQIRQLDRRFDLVVCMPDAYRHDPEALSSLLITTSRGERIPLGRLTTVSHLDRPASVNREWQKRRLVVYSNVRGRDLGSFVADVQRSLESKVTLPAGYFITYGGQHEHLIHAWQRLLIVVPTALAIILVLLYLSTHSVRDAFIVFTGAPLGALGGVLALWFRDMPFTISAAVGFIAVSGVSVLNGLVMITFINQLRRDGKTVPEAIMEGSLTRLRPVLMTALVASLGFVPMAIATGTGAEIQRPLATVVIGGISSSTLLTLVVLPAVYAWFNLRRADART